MDKLYKKLKELDPEERKKVQQYLKESKDGDETVKPTQLDWMYKSGKPDAEEYLLGKKIEKIAGDEEESGGFPNKVSQAESLDEIIERRQNIDMKAKMREDPLYQIKQREFEAKKRLLQNPIKMKQLQKMVEEKSKKGKKHKKAKKRKRRQSDSSEEDSDDEILNKYLAIIKDKKKEGTSKSQAHDQGEHSDHRSHRERHGHRHPERRSDKDRQEQRHSERSRHSRHSSGEREDERKLKEKKKGSSSKRRSSNEREQKRHDHRSQRESHEHRQPEHSRKLTKEEKEKKRREMMENAAWRDEQRERNIKQYQADDQKDIDETVSQGASFIKSMMKKHNESSSVEDRIKRNIFNVQRTHIKLDKKFTQK